VAHLDDRAHAAAIDEVRTHDVLDATVHGVHRADVTRLDLTLVLQLQPIASG
jgi:hypothetical protein